MYSDGGLQFEVIFFFSALSQMFVDQGFWQASPASCAEHLLRMTRSHVVSSCEACHVTSVMHWGPQLLRCSTYLCLCAEHLHLMTMCHVV